MPTTPIDAPRSPDSPDPDPTTQSGRDTLDDVRYAAAPGSPYYERLRQRIIAIEAEARSTPAEALDPLMPDSEVAEMLRKVIRQYHGTAHGGGSWLNCDDRWCADARGLLGQ